MQSYFPTGQIFSILKHWQVSKYKAMSSEFSSPKKWKESMVSLCNGGTKDFAELLEIIHFKI